MTWLTNISVRTEENTAKHEQNKNEYMPAGSYVKIINNKSWRYASSTNNRF